MNGTASHYGVVGNAAVIPELSCGFVVSSPRFEVYPFGNIASLSIVSSISDKQQGCGSCLEIKCNSQNCKSQTDTKIVTIYDVCSLQTNQVQCANDGIVLPAYLFQEFAPFQMGVLDIQYRQVECTPGVNITLIVDSYLRGQATAYLNIKFRDVAGEGTVSQVEVRQSSPLLNEQLLNNKWLVMNRFGQTGFDYSGVPEPPLDLRITGAAGQVAILKSIITQNTGNGEYDTLTQFTTGTLATTIPVVTDFPNHLGGICSCIDNGPLGVDDFSCTEQKRYGRCYEPYMIDRGWCASTCGRCHCPQTYNSSSPHTQEQPTITPLLQKEQQQLLDPPLLAVQFPQGSGQSQICPLALDGILSSSPDVKMFYEAITVSRIVEKLKDPYLALTVFAPNNYAFKLFLQKIGIEWETLKLNYPGILQRIVLYQIIPGIWDVGRLLAAGHGIKNPVEIITLLPYSSVNISATSSSSLVLNGPINFANSIWVDTSICDSIIHYVDQVVIPFADFTLAKLFEFQPVTELPFDVNATLVSRSPGQQITAQQLRVTATTNPIKLSVGNNSTDKELFQNLNDSQIFDPYTMNEVIKPELSAVSSAVVTTYQAQQINNNNQQQSDYSLNNDNGDQQQIQTVYTYTTDPQIVMESYYTDNSQADLGFSDLTQICPTILQIVQRNPNLGVFQQLIIGANYEDILDDAGRKFTVFAPTDDAFKQLLQSQNTSLDMVMSRPNELKILLGYHIVNGLYSIDELRIMALSPANNINKLSTYTQYNQQSVQIEIDQTQNGDILVKGVGSNATVEKQIRSCESVVHIINNVLLPFSVVQQQSGRPAMTLPTLQYTVYESQAEMQVVSENNSSIDVSQPQWQQISAPLGILSSPVEALECTSLQAFFGLRGAAQADLRYFQILIDVTFLQDALFYTRERISLFVPTNDGFDKGLQFLNSTFSSLLIDRSSSDSLVRYHVVHKQEELESLAPVTQTVNIPTQLQGYNLQLQPDDFIVSGSTLLGVTSYLTRAKILERVQTCQGIVYVVDNLLLPQGFQING